MKNALFTLLLNALAFQIFAQKPYELAWPRELGLVGGSGAGFGISMLLRSNNQPFMPDEVAALDVSQVPKFDLYATRHYSTSAQKASDIMAIGSFALPALLFLDPAIRRDAPEVVTIVGESLLLTTALTQLTKELAHRTRPFCYNPDVPFDPKLERDARLSFFSGHTSTTAALTFTTAKIWSDHHPSSPWKPVVWTSATLIPLTVGYLRMRGGKHFLSDVLVGFVIGAGTGWLVPHLHRRKGN
jgi:membrane-associated phospholipid phosphatase